MAVPSAGPYANTLHLAPDRKPHQHLITQFLQARCSFRSPTNSVKALKADVSLNTNSRYSLYFTMGFWEHTVKSHQITYHRGLCVSWPVYRPRRQHTLCQRPVQEQRMLDCHNTWTGDCPCHPTDHTHVTINTTHHPHSIHVSRQLFTSPFRQYTYHPHSIHVNKSTPPQEQQLHTLLDYCELCTLHHQGS